MLDCRDRARHDTVPQSDIGHVWWEGISVSIQTVYTGRLGPHLDRNTITGGSEESNIHCAHSSGRHYDHCEMT